MDHDKWLQVGISVAIKATHPPTPGDQKKHIVAKEVVGLLLGEVVVSTKKTHIVAKDVVGLQIGDMARMIV